MTMNQKTDFQNDLARIRKAQAEVRSSKLPSQSSIERLTVNPSLQIIPTAWHGLTSLLEQKASSEQQPKPGDDLVLVWKSPHDLHIYTEIALPADLAALKIILEEIDRCDAASEGNVSIGCIDNTIRHAVFRGLLLSPPSRLRRPASFLSTSPSEKSLSATIFTLQWHITQECDLSCLHCYDRSGHRSVGLTEGLGILDQMRDFCQSHHVRGQVSFSGGNPLLHPDFMTLYRAAADRGLATAILGNPTSSQQVSEIVAIQMPAYFQLSLEGLETHNDQIRGSGHFRRTIEFLDMIDELAVPSEVMLTLTRENLAQVIPLGELLRNHTGSFTFNRLALFGKGANLALPARDDYAAFLADYLTAMQDNPVLALKDSLFNIILEKENRELFDGCAGFGCGAAFNFVAVLPDGEVHACRKFPSPIGFLGEATLSDIYHSEMASFYREGSSSCRGCGLRSVCRGCPAVTASFAGNPLKDRDPFCFRNH
jgi:selenobiotic family peptide radical SAM maturase